MVSVRGVDLADGVLLLRDPALTDDGLALAAKLIVRELGTGS
jgi:hypothetical protein